MAGKEMLFFATGKDLYTTLKIIEQVQPVKYVKCGLYKAWYIFRKFLKYPVYNCVDAFENLGISISGDHNDNRFLVVDSDVEVVPRMLPGGYSIDAVNYPCSVIFWTGGLYGTDRLMNGRIAAAHGNDASAMLYKSFTGSFKKGFKKNRSYYIGPEALELAYANKIRLITMNVNQSIEYDFKITKG